jgi:hypothetical protein
LVAVAALGLLLAGCGGRAESPAGGLSDEDSCADFVDAGYDAGRDYARDRARREGIEDFNTVWDTLDETCVGATTVRQSQTLGRVDVAGAAAEAQQSDSEADEWAAEMRDLIDRGAPEPQCGQMSGYGNEYDAKGYDALMAVPDPGPGVPCVRDDGTPGGIMLTEAPLSTPDEVIEQTLAGA